MVQRKGSYFYVIDAFTASIIILAALFVLFSRFLSQQPSTQAFYTAEDFLTTLETTPVVRLDDPQIRAWITDGNITDSQISILEQIAKFDLTGKSAHAVTLSRITADRTPSQVGLRVLINGRELYSCPTQCSRGVKQQSDAETLLSGKRIVLIRQTPSDNYPPVIMEVQTWQ